MDACATLKAIGVLEHSLSDAKPFGRGVRRASAGEYSHHEHRKQRFRRPLRELVQREQLGRLQRNRMGEPQHGCAACHSAMRAYD